MGVDGKPDSDLNSTPTVRFQREELAELTARDAELAAADATSEAIGEWEEHAVAAGTPRVGDPPLMSRTVTVHDPLTTAVLAEVSRQSRPVIAVPTTPTADAHTTATDATDAARRSPR